MPGSTLPYIVRSIFGQSQLSLGNKTPTGTTPSSAHHNHSLHTIRVNNVLREEMQNTCNYYTVHPVQTITDLCTRDIGRDPTECYRYSSVVLIVISMILTLLSISVVIRQCHGGEVAVLRVEYSSTRRGNNCRVLVPVPARAQPHRLHFQYYLYAGRATNQCICQN